jgi:hypothetical protein
MPDFALSYTSVDALRGPCSSSTPRAPPAAADAFGQYVVVTCKDADRRGALLAGDMPYDIGSPNRFTRSGWR